MNTGVLILAYVLIVNKSVFGMQAFPFKGECEGLAWCGRYDCCFFPSSFLCAGAAPVDKPVC